ncbi:polysaccharide deacetylase family protein [Paenibacillus paridis]|uniref:polysaccharide deacetylase family protein n=1 Tax=Paenibacillus paridis TaxID=2583376 RepID=UPI0011243C9B|nr:polysaccharide deacetylase family protein [Paenibacillus paridis]
MDEKLDYAARERLLIIHADDFGLTRGANEAILHSFQRGTITSASIMMPCAAASEAVRLSIQNRIDDIGIHLTLTSDENRAYRPVCQKYALPSLTTSEGCFHQRLSDLELCADPEEVRIELEAQIQQAVSWGLIPTHLDSHAGSLMGLASGRDFLEITIDLCEQFELPLNLPKRIVEQDCFDQAQKLRFQQRLDSASSRGVLLIDDLVSLPYCFHPLADYERMKEQLARMIKRLKPGVTQLTVHPSLLTKELMNITTCYRERELEFRLLNDPAIIDGFKRESIQLITWKDMRDRQRRV